MSITDVRDAVIVALPLVWGGMTAWKRAKPALGAAFRLVRHEMNKPVNARIDVVEKDVEQLQTEVDTIVRLDK